LTKGLQPYSLPDPVLQDTFALRGGWIAVDQDIESTDTGVALVLRYRGAEVNLVAGADASAKVDVELDGVPLTTLTVMEHDLYNVVNKGPAGYHSLVFKPHGPTSVKMFAFTFGAGTR
jgi:hypothetical protein